MQFTTLALSLLASLGAVSGLALEKRVDHYGIATVNPNPSGADGSCGDSFKDSQMKVALSNYWMNVRLHEQRNLLGVDADSSRVNTRARTADERSS